MLEGVAFIIYLPPHHASALLPSPLLHKILDWGKGKTEGRRRRKREGRRTDIKPIHLHHPKRPEFRIHVPRRPEQIPQDARKVLRRLATRELDKARITPNTQHHLLPPAPLTRRDVARELRTVQQARGLLSHERCLAAARGAEVQLRVGPAVELLDHEGEHHNVGVWVGALGFEGCGAGCGRLAKVDGDVGLRGGVEFVGDGGRGDGCDGGEGGCRCCLLLVCLGCCC